MGAQAKRVHTKAGWLFLLLSLSGIILAGIDLVLVRQGNEIPYIFYQWEIREGSNAPLRCLFFPFFLCISQICLTVGCFKKNRRIISAGLLINAIILVFSIIVAIIEWDYLWWDMWHRSLSDTLHFEYIFFTAIQDCICQLALTVSLIVAACSALKKQVKPISIIVIVGKTIRIVTWLFCYHELLFSTNDISYLIYGVLSCVVAILQLYAFVALGGVCCLFRVEKARKKNKAESEVESTANAVDRIVKLKKLLDAGTITQDEFDEKKKEILNSSN